LDWDDKVHDVLDDRDLVLMIFIDEFAHVLNATL